MSHCLSVHPLFLSVVIVTLANLQPSYPTRHARNARHTIAMRQSFYVALERFPDNPHVQFCLARGLTGITLIDKRAPTDALTFLKKAPMSSTASARRGCSWSCTARFPAFWQFGLPIVAHPGPRPASRPLGLRRKRRRQ